MRLGSEFFSLQHSKCLLLAWTWLPESCQLEFSCASPWHLELLDRTNLQLLWALTSAGPFPKWLLVSCPLLGRQLNLPNSLGIAVHLVHCSVHRCASLWRPLDSLEGYISADVSYAMSWGSGRKFQLPPPFSALWSRCSVFTWTLLLTWGPSWAPRTHFPLLLFFMLLYFSIWSPNIGEAVSLLFIMPLPSRKSTSLC